MLIIAGNGPSLKLFKLSKKGTKPSWAVQSDVPINQNMLSGGVGTTGVSWDAARAKLAMCGGQWSDVVIHDFKENTQSTFSIPNGLSQNTCCFNKSGDILATGGVSGVVHLWGHDESVESMWTVQEKYSVSQNTINCLSFSSNSDLLISGDTKGSVGIRNMQNSDSSVVAGCSEVSALQCSIHENHEVCVGYCQGQLNVYNVETGDIIAQYPDHHLSTITDVAYSVNNGLLLASSGLDKKVRLLALRDNKVVKTYECEDPVLSVEFVKTSLVISTETEVMIYDLNTKWSERRRFSMPWRGTFARYQTSRTPIIAVTSITLDERRVSVTPVNLAASAPKKPSPHTKDLGIPENNNESGDSVNKTNNSSIDFTELHKAKRESFMVESTVSEHPISILSPPYSRNPPPATAPPLLSPPPDPSFPALPNTTSMSCDLSIMQSDVTELSFNMSPACEKDNCTIRSTPLDKPAVRSAPADKPLLRSSLGAVDSPPLSSGVEYKRLSLDNLRRESLDLRRQSLERSIGPYIPTKQKRTVSGDIKLTKTSTTSIPKISSMPQTIPEIKSQHNNNVSNKMRKVEEEEEESFDKENLPPFVTTLYQSPVLPPSASSTPMPDQLKTTETSKSLFTQSPCTSRPQTNLSDISFNSLLGTPRAKMSVNDLSKALKHLGKVDREEETAINDETLGQNEQENEPPQLEQQGAIQPVGVVISSVQMSLIQGFISSGLKQLESTLLSETRWLKTTIVNNTLASEWELKEEHRKTQEQLQISKEMISSLESRVIDLENLLARGRNII